MSPTAKLGAFMLAALLIIGVFIIKIEEIPIGTKGGRQRVQAVFPSVAGLDEKSAVRIAGVRVGIVEKIQLDGNRALATLALDPDVKLYAGAHAEVTSLGMLGDKYVLVEPGKPGEGPLPADKILEGKSPVSFDEVLKTANDIGGDIKGVTTSLRNSLAGPEGQKRIDDILENIRQLSADVRALVAANRVNVDATIANFRDFSATLKEELPKLAEKLNKLAEHVDGVVAENRGNFNESLANIKDLSAKLKVSADNLNQISGKIARGEGSIGKLVNDETTVNNLNSTLKSVESGVQSLKNTLGRAERWRLDINMRAESLTAVDKSRTAFGLDLHTTDKRFFRIEMVDSPFGRPTKQTQVFTTTYPDGHQETRTEERVFTTDSSSFNAQIGYHLADYTLRAGLFESKGGVGLDRSFAKDRLKLTLEAYDFNRDTKPPHVRVEGRYFVNKNIFAYAGWDDPVWRERRSVLFGAGITWQDEDLKYLLGTFSSIGK